MPSKKRLAIFPNIDPETDEDICFGVAEYCAEFNLPYEFISRTSPVVAVIDGCKYRITKQLSRKWLATFWVLRCREID